MECSWILSSIRVIERAANDMELRGVRSLALISWGFGLRLNHGGVRNIASIPLTERWRLRNMRCG